jgi:hypothetical protein
MSKIIVHPSLPYSPTAGESVWAFFPEAKAYVPAQVLCVDAQRGTARVCYFILGRRITGEYDVPFARLAPGSAPHPGRPVEHP